jgi:hypothetical protein
MREITGVEADPMRSLPDALRALRVSAPRPVLVLVGGASGLDDAVADRLLPLFRDRLAPLLARLGAVLVDGGTDAGVMALMGRARQDGAAGLTLIGVAARGTVRLLADDPADNLTARAALASGHSHVLLVPGSCWGDEIPWMSALAGLLAGGQGCATLVAGGGKITERDVQASLAAGRPTLLLAGSGGVADALAADAARNPLIRVVPEHGGWQALDTLLAALLQPRAACSPMRRSAPEPCAGRNDDAIRPPV